MNRHLRPSLGMPAIYLYRDSVDFRKSFRGLGAIVEQELGHNPFDGALYAFGVPDRGSVNLAFRRRISPLGLCSLDGSLQEW